MKSLKVEINPFQHNILHFIKTYPNSVDMKLFTISIAFSQWIRINCVPFFWLDYTIGWCIVVVGLWAGSMDCMGGALVCMVLSLMGPSACESVTQPLPWRPRRRANLLQTLGNSGECPLEPSNNAHEILGKVDGAPGGHMTSFPSSVPRCRDALPGAELVTWSSRWRDARGPTGRCPGASVPVPPLPHLPPLLTVMSSALSCADPAISSLNQRWIILYIVMCNRD